MSDQLAFAAGSFRRSIFCRRKALDARGVRPCQRVAHPDAGDHALRRYFREWRQHERACEQPRMRQREIRRLQCEVVIGEEVDINGAWTPTAFLGALASKRVLDRLSPRKKIMRRHVGFDCDAKIDEGRLALEAPGL